METERERQTCAVIWRRTRSVQVSGASIPLLYAVLLDGTGRNAGREMGSDIKRRTVIKHYVREML